MQAFMLCTLFALACPLEMDAAFSKEGSMCRCPLFNAMLPAHVGRPAWLLFPPPAVAVSVSNAKLQCSVALVKGEVYSTSRHYEGRYTRRVLSEFGGPATPEVANV